MIRLSFSSMALFSDCQRRFYYKYISKEKPSEIVDQSYANFGSCIHEFVERYKEFDNEKDFLNELWLKYNIDGNKFKKKNALAMLDYVKRMNLKIKSQEQKIHFNYQEFSFIAIVDAITEDNEIIDWKTSTFSKDKLKEYEKQTKFYAWAYYKKFGIMPKKVSVVFLKSEQKFERVFTEQDLNNVENEIKNTLMEMRSKAKFYDYGISHNCKFCEFRKTCFADSFAKKKEINVTLTETDTKVFISCDDRLIMDTIDKVMDEKFQYEKDNVHFFKEAMLKKTGVEHDGIIRLYDKRLHCLDIGFKKRIKKFFTENLNEHITSLGNKLNLRFVSKRNIPNVQFKLDLDKLIGKDLRPYQENAIESMLKDEISLSELSVGSGKTLMAAEIIRKLRYKCIFVVDTSTLLEQTKKEFKEILGIDCGTITEGEQNWSDVNLATIQTIIKLLKNKEFLNNLHECNLVFVDEAHCSKSNSYKAFFKEVKARYRIGLSGTPYSNGNDSLELYRTFGFPNLHIPLVELVNDGFLTPPKIGFLKYEFNDNGEPCIDYNEAYDRVLMSEERLGRLMEVYNKHKNQPILIITRRLEHADKIKEMIPEAVIIKGSVKKKDREKFIQDMKEGKQLVIIGTDKIVQKGLNIPNLEVLINFSANKGRSQTVQGLGRVIRKSEGKEYGYYYDFYDKESNLIGATKERIKAIKDQKFEVNFF